MNAAENPPPEFHPPTFVVGNGASAGGLESLEKLFQNLPADTGMAFVIIQHLSPDFKSMMYELLARDTKMEIHRVEDGMSIEANHVYLLPPKKELIVAGGELHLIDKDLSKGLTLPIDRFFESLAREFGSRAIGIILSGSGSDGSRRIRDLSQSGALVICESEKTAKFDGVPLSAQATGIVDMVLAPEEMGLALMRHAANPLEAKKEGDLAYKTEQVRLGLRGAEAIYELFRHEYDLDFSVYKEATVQRRISRRVAMSETPDIDSYAEKLRKDKSELNTLYQDLLIGVTQFFRDEEPFQYLKETILLDLLQKRPIDRTIRVWGSACATGEEAYSLAILFHEAFEAAGRPPQMKIFATDVHFWSSRRPRSSDRHIEDRSRRFGACRGRGEAKRSGQTTGFVSSDANETIRFPQLGISVSIVSVKGNRVQVGIDAPPEIQVLRRELEPEATEAGSHRTDSTRAIKASSRLPSESAKARHSFRNQLNRATLGLHLAQKLLAAGQLESADKTLATALENLAELESTVMASPAPNAKQDELENRVYENQRLRRPIRTDSRNDDQQCIDVLLVEDDLNEQALLKGLLEMEGYRVHSASNGVEALGGLSRITPKFVLLDMMMPECDGHETFNRIREIPAFVNLPIFAVSGSSPDSVGLSIGGNGVEEWFPKPLNAPRLVQPMRDRVASLCT